VVICPSCGSENSTGAKFCSECGTRLGSAARAIELSGPPSEAARLEAGLLDRLALAPSNDPAVGSGRELYLTRVKR